MSYLAVSILNSISLLQRDRSLSEDAIPHLSISPEYSEFQPLLIRLRSDYSCGGWNCAGLAHGLEFFVDFCRSIMEMVAGVEIYFKCWPGCISAKAGLTVRSVTLVAIKSLIE